VLFNAKSLIDEMLNFLRLPWLILTEHLNQLLLFIFAELRGTDVPEIRRELSEATFVPPPCPPTAP